MNKEERDMGLATARLAARIAEEFGLVKFSSELRELIDKVERRSMTCYSRGSSVASYDNH